MNIPNGNLESNRKGDDILQNGLLKHIIIGAAHISINLAGKILSTRNNLSPSFLPFLEPGIRRLRPENEQQRERGSGELVGQGGGSEDGEELRQQIERDGGVVDGDEDGDGGEGDDGRDEGEDDAGGEAGEQVADVAEGAPVLDPALVVVEVALLLHASLLDLVGPVGDGEED